MGIFLIVFLVSRHTFMIYKCFRLKIDIVVINFYQTKKIACVFTRHAQLVEMFLGMLNFGCYFVPFLLVPGWKCKTLHPSLHRTS